MISGERRHYRFLSHMMTGCVVWMDITPDYDMYSHRHRAPITSPELEYHYGLATQDIGNREEFWSAYQNYKLHATNYPMEFFNKDLPQEYVMSIKLARAKCAVIQAIEYLTYHGIDKNGTYNNPLFDTQIEPELIVDVYKRVMNIDVEQARKLYEFNLEEHRINQRDAKLIQIEAEMRINLAKTSEEVYTIFKDMLVKLHRHKSTMSLITKHIQEL